MRFGNPKRRNRVGVRAQVFALCALPIAFLIVVFTLAMLAQNVSRQSIVLSRQHETTLVTLDRAYATIDQLNDAIRVYTRDPGAAALKRYGTVKTQLKARLHDVLAAATATPEEHAQAVQYTSAIAALVPYADRYVAYMRAGNLVAARAAVTAPSLARLAGEIVAARNAIVSTESVAGSQERNALRRRFAALATAIVAVTAAGIVVSLALAMLFGLRTVRRLRALVSNAEHLSRRKPTEPISGSDEIADVDRATHELARRLDESLALQLALVPPGLPALDGLRLDSVYVPAANESRVGGDWYDVFEVSEHLVGISIGDVAGHGLRAASTMAALREAIRVAGRIERVPSKTLQRVNQMLCMDHPGELATALFGLFNALDGTFTFATAGHPPPLFVRPGEGLTVLEGRGLVLGIDALVSYSDHIAQAEVGSALVFYTDGMIEIDRDYFAGLRNLQSAVLDAYGKTAGAPATAIRDRLFESTVPADDAALLFVGVTRIGMPVFERKYVWNLDARDPVAGRRIKRAILWKLAGLSAGEPEYAAVEVIYGELLANVAMHTPGPATVTLEERDGVAILRFEDHGPPFQPHLNGRPEVLAEGGRGFWLISQFAHSAVVERVRDRNRVSVAIPIL